jgi:hypothetical protein
MVGFQCSMVSKPKRGKGSWGGVDSVAEMKAMRHRFSSFSQAWRRAVDGDAWHGGASRDGDSLGDQGGRKAPSGLAWAEMG